jgi:hypothetical protein
MLVSAFSDVDGQDVLMTDAPLEDLLFSWGLIWFLVVLRSKLPYPGQVQKLSIKLQLMQLQK